MEAAQQQATDQKEIASVSDEYHGVAVNRDVKDSATLSKLILLDLQNATFQEALQQVARLSGLSLSYQTKNIEINKAVTIDRKYMTVNAGIWKILEGTDLKYAVSSNKNLILMKRAMPLKQQAAMETVSGQVIDAASGDPLPGVNVVVKGTTTGAATDSEGNFSLNVPSLQDTLVISFIGYQRQEVPINGRTSFSIELRPQAISGEELVVVGYGSQQREDITGSVGIVDTEQMKKVSSDGLGEALEGSVAGLTVQGTGAPGEPASIKIRGVSSFGNNEPLYVVDGVPVESIEDFNMQDVESVQVLKGPSSAAIYGARAANGVVIVTTNTGQDGEIQVDYNGKVGYQDLYQRLDVTNAEQYREINNRSRTNVGLDIAAANDPNSPQFVDDVDTDWQDRTFQTGLQNDHHLTVSGGDEENRYSISLGYLN